MQQPSVEEPKVEWDPDDYMSVEPEFEAVLRSTESHDLIPALSIAEIMTCEQAELYSPEAMHKQLLDSSNTAVNISELKMIISNARETVRLKRANAWNPFVRMAAPAEVEGPADKSQTAGEHAALEPNILPKEAYRVSLGNKYRPLRASEQEPEREIRLTTSCIYGRSLMPVVVTSISRGTAMIPYDDQHAEATTWEARHRSVISRTRMDVSGGKVKISQGTSTMSRMMQVVPLMYHSWYRRVLLVLRGVLLVLRGAVQRTLCHSVPLLGLRGVLLVLRGEILSTLCHYVPLLV